MKIRNGFVSNSSSSSFVVIFPREPINAADVKNMLFNDELYYTDPYDDDKWTTDEVAETVWKDICEQEKNDFERAKEILSNQYGNGSPSYSDFDYIEDNHDRWKAYHDASAIYAEKRLKEFFNMRKLKLQKIDNKPIDGAVLYCFEYSDNDSGYHSALEHGGLFDKLKYIEINNH